ncbi:hypothetical protein CDAR_233321 [Caerostris darwini]|uniref:Uncharacterized protein n=1 Tax=Caerostris darwini TaxID=1538125 RepID=A0AAV4PPF4_9ARAC|nr:hypothetical protein CDAR_233321 [Caerostris darwini]
MCLEADYQFFAAANEIPCFCEGYRIRNNKSGLSIRYHWLPCVPSIAPRGKDLIDVCQRGIVFGAKHITRKLNSKICFPPRCDQGFVSLLNMCVEADYQFFAAANGIPCFSEGYGIRNNKSRLPIRYHWLLEFLVLLQGEKI